MVLELTQKVILTALDILNGASVWLIISFVLAGLMHNLISPDRLQRMLGNRSISALIKATVSGLLLPICSCGVIPLGPPCIIPALPGADHNYDGHPDH